MRTPETRQLVGGGAIAALGTLGGIALVLGHDGSILGAITGGIVAVVIAVLGKSKE